MEKLYLVRHGIAVDAELGQCPDEERRLTPRGSSRAREVARGLHSIGVTVDQIITSPLPRARETAEILFGELRLAVGALIEDDRLKPEAPLARIADWILGIDLHSLMLVGHNPVISDLISYLITGGRSDGPIFELKKCGVACLRFTKDEPPRLEWVATPRLLRNLQRN